MSYWYPDTPPPPTDEPTFMPSSWMLPSLLRPPRDVKKLFDGVALAPRPVPEMPGTPAR